MVHGCLIFKVVDHLFRVVGQIRVFVFGTDFEHGVVETLAGFSGFSGASVVEQGGSLEKRHVLLEAVLEIQSKNFPRGSQINI
jgi:hypothetical protein